MPIYSLANQIPDLADDVWIAPDASLIGEVRIEAGGSVWFGAVLRGDNELISVSAGTNIQEHAMLHTDMGFPLKIGNGCTVGHRAILHGCTIEDNSLIGMGSIILNGAVIGPNSLVGAGALITEGKTFPANSLIVGSPARVVRQLGEHEIERIKMSALNYQRNAQRFRTQLSLIRPA